MGMPQLIVTAVLVEGRSKSEVAREYAVSRRWVITLVQRFLAEGEAGLAPRSRRPRSSPRRTQALSRTRSSRSARTWTSTVTRPARPPSRSTCSSGMVARRR